MGRSPMQPDMYHIHMLVHRQFTKNNPLTALIIILAISPFMIFSTMYVNSSKYNILISIIFIIFYVLVYGYLFKKDKLEQQNT